MTDSERLVKREKLATLLFERVDDVQNYMTARLLAELVLDRIDREQDQVA